MVSRHDHLREEQTYVRGTLSDAQRGPAWKRWRLVCLTRARADIPITSSMRPLAEGLLAGRLYPGAVLLTVRWRLKQGGELNVLMVQHPG